MLLPEKVSHFFKVQIRRICGAVITLSGLLITTALLTYAATDPSVNTASAEIHNWLGLYGALTADIMVQTMGWAGFFIPLALFFWGLKIIRSGPIPHWWLRLAALTITVMTGSVAATLLPAWPGTEAHNGGGLLGLILRNTAVAPLDRLGVPGTIELITGISAIISLSLLPYISSFSYRNWMIFAINCIRFSKFVAAIGFYYIRVATVAFYNGGVKIINLIKDRGIAQEPKQSRKTKPTKPKLQTKKPAPVKEKTDYLEKGQRASVEQQPDFNFIQEGEYTPPPLSLLQDPDAKENKGISEEALQKNATLLQSVLSDFGVEGEIVAVHPGPIVTLYELEPAPGIKSSRVISLADDIARSMAAISVRIAVIPGRRVIGIEMPNSETETVYLREILASKAYEETDSKLGIVLGKQIAGQPVIADLAKMPHLLIAGTTGSGKSVGINAMILSILYRMTPEQCRLIMVDPKMLELSVYDGIPHLLTPVVTEPEKAIVALKWAVREMEDRYRSMAKMGVRNIEGYNARLREARKKGEILTRKVQTGFDADTGKPVFEEQPISMSDLPYIVVVVDEFADLMLVAGKEVEAAIQRLAQMARAAGIHLIMATQRPSVDVITGTIKANFPSRISFQVTSRIDSRTILGDTGAEHLLGKGDMLYMAGGGRISRVHGPYVSDEEVEAVTQHLREQSGPDYLESVTDESAQEFADGSVGDHLFGEDDDTDDLFDKAVAIVARSQRASTSYLQRQLSIGYNRAANIIDSMEENGMIGAADHVGRREVNLRKPDVHEDAG